MTPTWPPELIDGTLVKAYVYTSRAAACFRSVPEAALRAASLKIHAYISFN